MWDDLTPDVYEELTDPQFSNRTHYRKATSAAGCHGPLCRKAERDEARKRTQVRAEARGREYKPVAPGPVRKNDAELDRIIAWHESLRRRMQTMDNQPHCASCACAVTTEGVA